MGTRVVNLKTYNGDVIYIGRPSRWGNPFRIGRDGNRAECLTKYKVWVEAGEDQNTRWIREHIYYLRDKALGCFCAPLPCHGDILAEWAENNPWSIK